MSSYQQFNSLEWLNENMSRNYPIVGTASSKLPSSFIVDIQLVIPYMENVDTSRFFVSSINRMGDSLQIIIGYLVSDPASESITCFDCAVSAGIPIDVTWPYLNQAGTDYMATSIVPIIAETTFESSSRSYGIPESYKELRDMHGFVYIGTCADMQNVSSLTFSYGESAIIPIRVYMQSKPDTLKEVTLVDTNGISATFKESMVLLLGEGLTVDMDVEHNTASISVDSEWVENKLNTKLAELDSASVKTINGISPDSTGNIQLIGLDCTSINVVDTGVITISNPCSKPCCNQNGEDVASVNAAMAELITAKDVLNNYYTELTTKVNSMQARLASLIASRR